MKEHPILFSGEMVRAILNGMKTQTRRVIKPQPILMDSGTWYPSEKPGDARNRTGLHYANEYHMRKGMPIDFCPYGQPGDRLWVRETFVFERWDDEPKPPTDRVLFHHEPDRKDEYDNEYWLWPHYKATDPAPELFYEDDEMDEPQCKWCPSIHMPRWASRLTLEIINVRVERVQDIAEEDAEAEGIHLLGLPVNERYNYPRKHIVAFCVIWNLLNAKRGYSWESNPWVWAIEFKRVAQ